MKIISWSIRDAGKKSYIAKQRTLFPNIIQIFVLLETKVNSIRTQRLLKNQFTKFYKSPSYIFLWRDLVIWKNRIWNSL